eukprot:673797_1
MSDILPRPHVHRSDIRNSHITDLAHQIKDAFPNVGEPGRKRLRDFMKHTDSKPIAVLAKDVAEAENEEIFVNFWNCGLKKRGKYVDPSKLEDVDCATADKKWHEYVDNLKKQVAALKESIDKQGEDIGKVQTQLDENGKKLGISSAQVDGLYDLYEQDYGTYDDVHHPQYIGYDHQPQLQSPHGFMNEYEYAMLLVPLVMILVCFCAFIMFVCGAVFGWMFGRKYAVNKERIVYDDEDNSLNA